MFDKNTARLRRSKQTRARIRDLRVPRLTVIRSNQHIYAQVYSADGAKVVASASTAEKEVRGSVANGGNKAAAAVVGKRVAERAKQAGIEAVAFDRAGLKYHGRIQALAEAAREAGLKF
jgi:large subunit ribosomal protein L18